jgi:hypothetical protein
MVFGCPSCEKHDCKLMEAECVDLSMSCNDLFPNVSTVQELAGSVGLKVNDIAKMHIQIHKD